MFLRPLTPAISVVLHLVGAVLCGAQGTTFELKDNCAFPVSVVNFDDCDSFPEEADFFAVLCRCCRLQARPCATSVFVC